MKIYYIILLVFLSSSSYTQIKVEQIEQTQTVHQYIVQQAYQYLYSKLGRSIPVLENHLGNWETGSNYFNPGNKIVIGAYREDEEDIVYNNGWPNETSTHFWNPDDGDGSQFCNSIQQCFPNAYAKAQKYLFGGWQFNYLLHVWGLPNNNGVPCATQLANLHLSYYSLVDLFVNKRILINAVEFFGQGTVTYNPPRIYYKILI